jgi:hypothetical protein
LKDLAYSPIHRDIVAEIYGYFIGVVLVSGCQFIGKPLSAAAIRTGFTDCVGIDLVARRADRIALTEMLVKPPSTKQTKISKPTTAPTSRITRTTGQHISIGANRAIADTARRVIVPMCGIAEGGAGAVEEDCGGDAGGAGRGAGAEQADWGAGVAAVEVEVRELAG